MDQDKSVKAKLMDFMVDEMDNEADKDPESPMAPVLRIPKKHKQARESVDSLFDTLMPMVTDAIGGDEKGCSSVQKYCAELCELFDEIAMSVYRFRAKHPVDSVKSE